jgi:hypothetical protein
MRGRVNTGNQSMSSSGRYIKNLVIRTQIVPFLVRQASTYLIVVRYVTRSSLFLSWPLTQSADAYES